MPALRRRVRLHDNVRERDCVCDGGCGRGIVGPVPRAYCLVHGYNVCQQCHGEPVRTGPFTRFVRGAKVRENASGKRTRVDAAESQLESPPEAAAQDAQGEEPYDPQRVRATITHAVVRVPPPRRAHPTRKHGFRTRTRCRPATHIGQQRRKEHEHLANSFAYGTNNRDSKREGVARNDGGTDPRMTRNGETGHPVMPDGIAKKTRRT